MNEMINLEKTKTDLINHFQEIIVQLQNTDIKSLVEEDNISTGELKDEKFVRQLAAKLPKTGSHIYWFKVDKPDKLTEQFKKRSIDSKYKVARDNKNLDSKYIYVGSCTKMKLSDRFKQHCGWGNDQTYSLQLNKWIGDTNLLFTFSYIEIEDNLMVQYIEDQLHRDLKPLFGKLGGNNKVRVIQ